MKTQSKFIQGLILGSVLPLTLFLFMSAKTDTSRSTDQVDPYKGGFVTTLVADSLINQYSDQWVKGNALPANTTTGGYIGKANLAQLACAENEEEYIKFNFYYTQGEANAPQIGIIFYPTPDATSVLMTGSSSYCPTQCVTPGN